MDDSRDKRTFLSREKRRRGNTKIRFINLLLIFAAILIIGSAAVLEILLLPPKLKTDTLQPAKIPADIKSSGIRTLLPDAKEPVYKIADIPEYEGWRDNIEMLDIDFEKLREQDPDIFAWVYLRDMQLSFAVADYADKLPGYADPLDLNLFGTANASKDSRNSKDFEDVNTVIYVRQTDSGLRKYRDVKFYDKYPVIMLFTESDAFALEVFSVYESVLPGGYNPIKFSTEAEYADYIKDIKNRSFIHTWVDVTSKEKIVTLITDSDINSSIKFIVNARITRVYL